MWDWLCISFSTVSVQGPIPPALGMQPQLVYVQASHNRFSGPLDGFAHSVSGSNIVHYFDISANQLTGPVEGLGQLSAVARVGTILLNPETRMPTPNVLNISGNNFEGALPLSYYADADAGGPDRLPLVVVRSPLSKRAAPAALYVLDAMRMCVCGASTDRVASFTAGEGDARSNPLSLSKSPQIPPSHVHAWYTHTGIRMRTPVRQEDRPTRPDASAMRCRPDLDVLARAARRGPD